VETIVTVYITAIPTVVIAGSRSVVWDGSCSLPDTFVGWFTMLVLSSLVGLPPYRAALPLPFAFPTLHVLAGPTLPFVAAHSSRYPYTFAALPFAVHLFAGWFGFSSTGLVYATARVMLRPLLPRLFLPHWLFCLVLPSFHCHVWFYAATPLIHLAEGLAFAVPGFLHCALLFCCRVACACLLFRLL
jgi:hypothetical protein